MLKTIFKIFLSILFFNHVIPRSTPWNRNYFLSEVKTSSCLNAMFLFLFQMHAARTGHKNFSESTEEIKPLSEEEKKAQLEKYVWRIAHVHT